MSRARRFPRCEACRMLAPLCLCAQLPRLATRVELVLVIHTREWRQTSNTGRVAKLCLEGAELAIVGLRDRPLDPNRLARDGRRHVLLHPGEDAPLLTPALGDARPVRLLVPDGTWRQSKRIAKQLSLVPDVERARIEASAGPVLRRAPTEAHLNTGDAIAAALEALGEPEQASALRAAVGAMIDRTLFTRGQLRADRVRGGMPEDARRLMSAGVPEG